ncbi:MAG: hypothetical protein K5656_12060 [Lachnospiraceae bacterium]|nr:hypothetical protein [Lachnospiraceae bacterium]
MYSNDILNSLNGSGVDAAQAEGILAIIAVFGLALLVVGVISWLLTAIPLFIMGKNAGVTNAWLAWIPIGNMYVLNALGGDEFSLFGDKIHFNERISAFWLWLALSFGGGLLSAIPLIGALVSFAAGILLICVQWRMIYDLMNAYNPGRENMVLSIVALIINLVLIILLWIYKGRTPSYVSSSSSTYDAGYDASYNQSYNSQGTYQPYDSGAQNPQQSGTYNTYDNNDPNNGQF